MLFFLACLAGCLCACSGGDSTVSTESDVTPGIGTDAAPNTQESGGANAESNSAEPQESAKEQTAFEKLFANGPIPAQNTDELWGYIDNSGSWAISPTYAETRAFWDSGLALAQDAQSKLWGLIDSSGQYVVEPSFDMISNRVSDGLFLVRAPERGWGYIDTSGAFVIEPQFDAANDFSNGFARVSSEIRFTGADNQYYYQLWGYINISGERITEDIFYEAYDFSEGLACINDGNPSNPFYGYIDELGMIVIPADHSDATSFSDGVAFVDAWNAGNMYYTLIGKDGYPLSDFICKSPNASQGSKARFSHGLLPVQTADQTGYVYINTSGEVVLPKEGEPYQYASSFSGNGYAAASQNNLYGYIDLEGNWVVPPQYSSASSVYHDMGFVRETGSFEELVNETTRNGIIDISGNYIVEFSEDVTTVRWYPEDRIIVKEKATEKIGYWNLVGDVVIDYIFDDAQPFAADYSYAKVKYNNLWGLIDKDGNWLIPAQYLSLG